MKRFIRYTAVLGAVMTVLGFGTAWAAKLNGGAWNGKEIWGTSIAIPFIGRRHHFEEGYHGYQEAEEAQKLDENTLVFPVTDDLNLELEAGKVTVKTGEAQEIRVVCKDLEKMGDLVQFHRETDEDEDELNIYIGPASAIGYLEVEVIVPAGYPFRNAEIFVGAGECDVEELNADDLEIEVTAGTAKILNGTAGDAEFQCAAGNLEYTGTITRDVQCECAAGKIGLTLFQEETEFNYKVDGVGGNIQLGDSDLSGLAFEREFYHNAPREMELSCATGSIQVRFTDSKLEEDL